MRIQDAIEEYLAAKHNPVTHDTYAWYAHFLDVFNDWCTANGHHDLSALTTVHVQQFVGAAPTNNTHTRHARAQVVKGFQTWCVLDDEMGVKERTIRRIEIPKVEQSTIDLFTDDDVRHLFRACDKMRTPIGIGRSCTCCSKPVYGLRSCVMMQLARGGNRFTDVESHTGSH